MIILKASEFKQMEFVAHFRLGLLVVCLICLKIVASLSTSSVVREVDLNLTDKTQSVNDTTNQTTPAPIWLVSKSLFVANAHRVGNGSGIAISSSVSVKRSSRLKQPMKLPDANRTVRNLNGKKRESRDWFTLALVDEDSIGKAAAPVQEDATLLQTIKNQTDESNADQLPSSDGTMVSYQDDGQLAALGPVSHLNQSFLLLFDELWLIKNTSATNLIKLNYFGNLTGSNQRWPFANGTNFKDQDKTSSTVLASGKEQVANRLFQTATRAISNWISIGQQRLLKFKERIGVVLRNYTKRKWDNTAKVALQPGASNQVGRADDNQLKESKISMDSDESEQNANQQDQQMAMNRARSRRSVNLKTNSRQFQSIQTNTDFNIVWQQQQQLESCNKLTIDEENKCRSMEQTINLNLTYTFPGTLKAIEENCRHVNYLLTNCWIQQSIQLRMSLASRNESTQNFTNQPLTPVVSSTTISTTNNNEQSQSFSVLVNGCGVEPSSPQYIRDRVSWMWLNLCIDKRFRRGYTSNLGCLSVWSQPRAQRICGAEYNRMQNYLLSQANGGRAAALGLSYNWTTNATKLTERDEKFTSIRMDNPNQSGDSNNAAAQATAQDNQTEAVAAVSSVANAASAAGVSSSQLVAASTFGLSESELIDREISSKMLCCMFDQFLRCVHKQAIWDCGRRGAQFVVDFMSRIGTDDMKYLCNADSKSSPQPPQAQHAPATPIDTRNQPTNWLPVSMPSPSPYRPNVPQPSSNSFASPIREQVDKQRPLAATSEIGSNRNPFIDNNYCIDPRIQNALTTFSSSPGSSEPATGTNSNPKSNPNGPSRTRPPSYDPAYFDMRDFPASGSASNLVWNKSFDLFVVLVSMWLLAPTFHQRTFPDYAISTR